MVNIFETKTFLVVALVAIILNVIFSLVSLNWFAAAGWFVALCYFPYKNIQDKTLSQKMRETERKTNKTLKSCGIDTKELEDKTEH